MLDPITPAGHAPRRNRRRRSRPRSSPSTHTRSRPSPGAIKASEHRHREREGVVRCYYVPVHFSVLETLIDRGMPATETQDPKAVGRELGAVLLQWVQRWRRERGL
jgi:hypothetical protein